MMDVRGHQLRERVVMHGKIDATNRGVRKSIMHLFPFHAESPVTVC
mgnify:CR=1 FL=1